MIDNRCSPWCTFAEIISKQFASGTLVARICGKARITIFYSFPPSLEHMHLLAGFAVCFISRKDGDPGPHDFVTSLIRTQGRFIKIFIVKSFLRHDPRFSNIKCPVSKVGKQLHNSCPYLWLLHQYVRDASAIPCDIHRVGLAVLGSKGSEIVCVDLSISHHTKAVQMEHYGQ